MAVLLLTSGDRLLLTDGLSGLLLADGEPVASTAGRVTLTVKADRITVEVAPMARPITPGTRVRVYATFETAPTGPTGSHTATTPTTVTARLTDPTGATTTPSWTATGTGTGYVDVEPSTSGRWHLWLEGDGDVTATAETVIAVATPSTVSVPLTP